MAVMTLNMKNTSMSRNEFVKGVMQTFNEKFPNGEVVGIRVLMQAEPKNLPFPGKVEIHTDWDSQEIAQEARKSVASALDSFCDKDCCLSDREDSVTVYTRRVTPVEKC